MGATLCLVRMLGPRRGTSVCLARMPGEPCKLQQRIPCVAVSARLVTPIEIVQPRERNLNCLHQVSGGGRIVTALLRHEDLRVGEALVPNLSGSANAALGAQNGDHKVFAMSCQDSTRDFSALVREYRKPLYRFVLRHVGRPADA